MKLHILLALILLTAALGGCERFDTQQTHYLFTRVALTCPYIEPVEVDVMPSWELPYDEIEIIGDRLGDILKAKVLINVEDYVVGAFNLGIVSVSGNILSPGDGTGYSANRDCKRDLWVAGAWGSDIQGTVVLFAEAIIDKKIVKTTATLDIIVRQP